MILKWKGKCKALIPEILADERETNQESQTENSNVNEIEAKSEQPKGLTYLNQAFEFHGQERDTRL